MITLRVHIILCKVFCMLSWLKLKKNHQGNPAWPIFYLLGQGQLVMGEMCTCWGQGQLGLGEMCTCRGEGQLGLGEMELFQSLHGLATWVHRSSEIFVLFNKQQSHLLPSVIAILSMPICFNFISTRSIIILI